jgi:dolichyl-phosphate-mannose-protein mannosyltransferase
MGRKIKNRVTIRLGRNATDTILLSHNIASPYYKTNQESTIVSLTEAHGKRVNNTLFEVRLDHSKKTQY